MLERLVEAGLRNRLLILTGLALLCALGVSRLLALPVDAFPDTTPVQVQINTVAEALNPEEIERQITLPIELAVSGLPGLENVRSVSKFGFSQVVATFDGAVSVYSARQFVSERLTTVELPEGIERPQLGPVATGLGEVLHYIVRSDDPQRTLTDLRTLHDWVIKPELLKVAGVAEVNSWGGYEKQYHIVAEPDRLVSYGLSLRDLSDALRRNNLNVGGGRVERSGEVLLVHGLGRVDTLESIASIPIAAYEGTPVLVRDVASVRIDHEIRRGAVTYQGKGEAVLGLGFMLMGENTRNVAAALRERLEAVEPSLPADVSIEIVYDRTELVGEVINTVTHNLIAGALLVVVVLFVLLGNVRAGILVAMTIPLAMVFAVLGMFEMSIAASLLSLGAIDFGILVDGSVVMAEANLRSIATESKRLGRALTRTEHFHAVLSSSKEVARPIAFGMGIILIVFVPILTLEGVEAKMFKPMAWTFIFALSGALFLALFVSPALSSIFLPRRLRAEYGPVARAVSALYGGALHVALRLRWIVLAAVVALVVVAGSVAGRLGGEFTPRLSEGAIVANVIRLAGISIDSSTRYNSRIEQLLLDAFPDEIEHVWSRIGTAEVATDPMGIELTDIFMTLKPRSEWTRADTQEELVSVIETELGDLPGLNIAYSQPIELRMNEMVSGIRSDIGIKVYGDDFSELTRIADDIQRVLLEIDGAADLAVDQLTGQPALQIRADPERLGRHGIDTASVLNFVEAVGGSDVGRVYEGQRVFPMVLRLPDRYRNDVDALRKARVPTDFGPQLELNQIADITETDTPSTITREWSRRLLRVQANVRGRDVSSFVDEAQRRVAEAVPVPEGYVVEWGGQYRNLERARLRLAIIVPLTLMLVFFLLYMSLQSVKDVLIISSGIPFAAIGGILALYARGIPFSVSAAVGFIALCGIAVLNGQVLVSAVRGFLAEGSGLWDAVREGGKQRLRPVLATAITDAVGFLPMALSTGVGAEVQRPLATVVIGGVTTSTLLTLFVLPVLYVLVHRRVVAAVPAAE